MRESRDGMSRRRRQRLVVRFVAESGVVTGEHNASRQVSEPQPEHMPLAHDAPADSPEPGGLNGAQAK